MMIPIFAGMYVREISVSSSEAQARPEACELDHRAYTQGWMKKIWLIFPGVLRDLRGLTGRIFRTWASLAAYITAGLQKD